MFDNTHRFLFSAVLTALLLGIPSWAVAAEPVVTGDPDDPPRDAAIVGTVVDAETGEPLIAARVRLRETGRNELSHGDGSFHFYRLSAGRYTVVAERIGYAPAEERVRIEADGDTVRIELAMRPTALDIAGVVVTGTGRERGIGETYQPTSVLSDAELRRRIAPSVAATIGHEPGIHQQYNGPAANQPIIRGMGGDRVLVLEDGQRVGDLYSTGADHAVTIEPLTASRIEVVRGPAALLYGSNALGGVVNVVRNEVPRTLPERITGLVSAHAESVNRGTTAGAAATLPVADRLAVRGELSLRQAGDTRTPLGILESTDMQGYNGGAGLSWITSWGHLGAAYRQIGLDYGVPGEFNGELIPGAHVGGVDIETLRRSGRFEAAHRTGIGFFSGFELDANIVQYLHDEIEGTTAAGLPIIGARFDQLSGAVDLVGRHEHENGGWLLEGAAGLGYRGKDLLASGGSPGTRSANEQALSAYIYEELGTGPFRLQVGGRYDWARLRPYSTDPIVSGSGNDRREIPVTERTFGSFSGSLGGLWDPAPGWTVGVSVARAFRTPAIQELFSDGPHLADFSFDIGNPQLEPEVGHGVDAFVRAQRDDLRIEAGVFANSIRNYIYYEATGELDPRFRRYPVFQARGDDALFVGAEGRAQWEPVRGWVVDAVASLVRAERTATGDPLPDIPPVNGSLDIRRDTERWFASVGWQASAAQNRVPSPFDAPVEGLGMIRPQEPTPGHGLLNGSAGYRWTIGEQLHTITLNAHNLLDTEWRDHLSRIKEVAPQPGRNLQLLYRMSF